MSERLERYRARKARAEVRQAIGSEGVSFMLGGLGMASWGAFRATQPHAWSFILGGVALACIGFGLYHCRPWSRWPGAVLLLVAAAVGSAHVAKGGFDASDLFDVLSCLAFSSGAVYLALPISGRHFRAANRLDESP